MLWLVFNYEQISRLNTTETYVYNYVIQNIKKVLKMSIRELAEETHVSTATIIRFCKKLDCDGFVEFKYMLKQSTNHLDESLEELNNMGIFFEYAKTEDYKQNIQKGTQLIKQAGIITIVGFGINSDFARYSARLFSHIGYFSYAVDDPEYPIYMKDDRAVVVVFYEEAQKELILRVIEEYHKNRYQVILISRGHVKKMDQLCEVIIHISDDDVKIGEIYSRIPVIYTIENLANGLKK